MQATSPTVADLLLSRLRPVHVLLTDNDGLPYAIIGSELAHWLKQYQGLEYRLYDYSCGHWHYIVSGTDDFLQAVIVME